MRKTILIITVAVATAAFGTSVAATASTTHKTEQFSFIDTAESGQTFSVIATGAFTDGGTYRMPRSGAGTLRFPGGTIKFQTHVTKPPVTTLNQANCLAVDHASGTYTVLGGTGIYEGITGSGKFTQSAHQVGPTVKGKCSFTSGNPVASHQIINGSGRVSLP